MGMTVNPRSSVCFKSPMLHAKFQEHRALGLEKYFYRKRIYTRLPVEFKCQNGYLLGSRSKSSAKKAIYTAAGCQSKIAILHGSRSRVNSDIDTAVVCPHKIII